MTTVTVPSLLQTFGQHRLLTAAQLQEVKRLEGRFKDPNGLLQELQRRGWLTAFQCQVIVQGRAAELTLGPYRLLDRLGEGASGQVFKAHDERSGLLVALKVLRKEMQDDAERTGRFCREMEVAGRVLHPNVVRAYEAATYGSALVLAMEYVQGTDLDRLVKDSGPLPAARAADYIRQAALGLQHAHERGLVHRDIKPANLLLTAVVASGGRKPPESGPPRAIAPGSPGIVKILDLGLARLQEPDSHSSSSNLTIVSGNQVTIGSPDYLAPEQALDLHTADIRADVYSLGCTFYFLLTGRPPFPGGTLAEKLMRHQMAEPHAVTKVRAGLPPELDPILQRMLAKRPVDRYQTPGEVARVLSQNFLSAGNGKPVPSERKRGPRPWWLRPALAAGGLLIAGLLVWAILPSGRQGQAGTTENKPPTLPVVTLQPTEPTAGPTPTLPTRQVADRVVILQGRTFVRDALISHQRPEARFGSAPRDNALTRTDQGNAFLVRFDMARAGLPARSRVRQATVSFYVWDPHNNARTKVCAFPMRTEWDEATVAWNQPAEGKTWQGAGGHFGGGIDTGAHGQPVVVQPDQGGVDTADPPIEYQLQVSRMVQAWLDGSLPNHGLAIAPVVDRTIDDGNQSRFQIFASEHSQVQYTPRLTITLLGQ